MSKKVRCPRCDNPLFVDLDKYVGQHAVHLHCTECGKDFGVRLKQPKSEEVDRPKYGSITVIENDYCYRQEHELYVGRNMIGRRTKGNVVEIAIESGDIDMARNHCIIDVIQKENGEWQFSLSDFGSRKGTYFKGERMGKYDKINLEDKDVVVIGSTIFTVNIPRTQ